MYRAQGSGREADQGEQERSESGDDLSSGRELSSKLLTRFQQNGDDLSLSLPYPPHPGWTTRSSHRVRSRCSRRRRVWRLACKVVESMNRLYSGRLEQRAAVRGSPYLGAAHECAWAFIVAEIAQCARERRKLTLTRAQAAAALSHSSVAEVYGGCRGRHAQVDLVADLVEEPKDDGSVCMLEALPPMEREFYRYESNVLDAEGIAPALLEELTRRFVFVGGRLGE